MYAISQNYPRAEVTLLSSPGRRGAPGASELLEGASWLKQLIIYYSDDLASRDRRRELLSQLRASEFDIWFELPASLVRMREILRNMLVARLAGAKWGYGWQLSTIRLAAQAQSERFTFPTEVERLVSIVMASGIPVESISYPLPIREHHQQRVSSLLNSVNTPLVAIAPGAKRPTNRWPVERFAEVGRYLKDNFAILVLGGASEQKICAEVATAVGRSTLNLAGKTSLLESAEILRRCRLAICNDSGTQHLAAAVGTPCISIFSRRDLKGKWWPYGSQHTVLYKDIGCHTCFLDNCPYENRCLNMVSAPEVVGSADRLLRPLAATQTPTIVRDFVGKGQPQ
ncbi:MAG: glycosyltransferase family 9 protein [Deltaproteobacteria bacterium]|nr:glycosyltransferase family 9 protein [Deltaproteobacteria bacterium]